MPGRSEQSAEIRFMNDFSAFPIALDGIAMSDDPLVRIALGKKGLPVAACAAGRVEASAERVWSVLSDVSKYAVRVPLIDRVRLHGDSAEFLLRLKLAFFSVSFSFESEIRESEGKTLDLRYLKGEPKDIAIRYDVLPLNGGSESAIFVRIGFDIESLGWLVKFFLKNHPEIQFGVFPGCAVALLESMRVAVRELPAA
jgi:ribosome-associated toxin RatA of RatAB toxin-antitoxin module